MDRMRSARQQVVRLSRALGLESQLRKTKRLFESPVVERDRRDNQTAMVVMAVLLSENDSAIDIGAHRGGFLDAITRFAPEGHHIAYEPLPDLARGLRERFAGVDVREVAVSDSEGTRRFFLHEDYARSGLFRSGDKTPSDIVVRTARLDDDLPAGFAPKFIKIDVEGAEGLVFRGARHTLATHRPVVLFEHGLTSRVNGIASKEVWEMLVPLGYRIFDLDGRGYDLASFEDARVWYFVAVPERA